MCRHRFASFGTIDTFLFLVYFFFIYYCNHKRKIIIVYYQGFCCGRRLFVANALLSFRDTRFCLFVVYFSFYHFRCYWFKQSLKSKKLYYSASLVCLRLKSNKLDIYNVIAYIKIFLFIFHCIRYRPRGALLCWCSGLNAIFRDRDWCLFLALVTNLHTCGVFAYVF